MSDLVIELSYRITGIGSIELITVSSASRAIFYDRALWAKYAVRVREVPSSNLGNPTRHVSRLPTRESLFLLIPRDYLLKKVIIPTKSGAIGGIYIKDHHLSSHARIHACH